MPFDIRTLTISLGGARILHGLDFSLPKGGITGIIGANGSGKTTLLRALAGLLPPESGQVLHDSEEIARMPARLRARRIAMLPQSAQAPPGLSVRQLVARGRTPWLRPFLPMTPADRAAVGRALQAVGLSDLADRQVDSLSGGQRQRAWIALVLAQESGTILLDEPLNFLDLPHQAELVALLKRLGESRNVIMILHDLTIAARVCDRMLALRNGRLTAFGPTAQVLAQDPLRETFGIAFDCTALPDGRPVVLPAGL
ncbi:ABC transporter ATP-binding protein [Paracoccus siganidrum]|uniref:ABC transporter ATP-binding protein n=1 Tax=Paracoccus siganidrum TaxID=1276757 RepID=A0A419A5Z5_9RHOB|nr:ABC transporter ATP-binding protein [Paracoccus siganidrum]RJL13068.1 ABC transporter ATP-binding protein [Paracoccus siganidrum]RMC33024.1 ABC transporter ATP-binding protein [Paracoccus siganidrum]